MSLLSPPPEPSNKYKALPFTVAALAIALAIVLYFAFRYYPEKRAAEHFLDALVAGHEKQAYELWKPSESYKINDFVAALAIALAIVLYFAFRYYPEKRAAEHFLDALVAGHEKQAYELWKPSESYKINDFVAALAIALAIVLYFAFRYYPEKRAAEHFLDALVAGHEKQAYELWKPSESYKINDFVAALAIALAIVLYFAFRYYPEKRAAEHFLDALVAGHEKQAYELWKPSESYKINDFMADWGPEGYYGPVKSYAIGKASSGKGANGVVLIIEVSPFSPMPDKTDVEKSRRTKQLNLWVRSEDKALSFPPSY